MNGPPNPKTLIPPVIVPPAAAFDAWRHSSAAPNNYTNSTSIIEYSGSSGYGPPQFVPITVPPTRIIFSADIDPIDVRYLGGPNSWTRSVPRGVNTNLGINLASQNVPYKAGEVFFEDGIVDTELGKLAAMADCFTPTMQISRTNLPANWDPPQNRTMIQNHYIDQTAAHRLDIGHSALRKRNSELWQQRVAPISGFKFA